jgi:hypothetical protein
MTIVCIATLVNKQSVIPSETSYYNFACFNFVSILPHVSCPYWYTVVTYYKCVIFKLVSQVEVTDDMPAFLMWVTPWHCCTHWTHLKH